MVKGGVGSQGLWRDGRDLDASWRSVKATRGREDTGTLRQGLLALRIRTHPAGPCGFGCVNIKPQSPNLRAERMASLGGEQLGKIFGAHLLTP